MAVHRQLITNQGWEATLHDAVIKWEHSGGGHHHCQGSISIKQVHPFGLFRAKCRARPVTFSATADGVTQKVLGDCCSFVIAFPHCRGMWTIQLTRRISPNSRKKAIKNHVSFLDSPLSNGLLFLQATIRIEDDADELEAERFNEALTHCRTEHNAMTLGTRRRGSQWRGNADELS